MIEIPLPAGIKLVEKKNNFSNGNFIEYQKNKIVYFYKNFAMGTTELNIPISPIFKGNFVMPAAKISLMYYPFIYGNNENKIVVIK